MKEIIVVVVILFWVYTVARHWGNEGGSAKAKAQLLIFIASLLLFAVSFFGIFGTIYQEEIKNNLQIVINQKATHFVVARKYHRLRDDVMPIRYFPFYFERESVTNLFIELQEFEDVIQ